MRPTFRESLWLPAIVLAVGVLFALGLLTAAGRTSIGGARQQAYPPPQQCVYLPLIETLNPPTPAGASAAEGLPAPDSPSASAAYPPPGACGGGKSRFVFLPLVRR